MNICGQAPRLFVIVAAMAIAAAAADVTKEDFARWRKQHVRRYSQPHEEAMRFERFQQFAREAADLNAEKSTAVYGINQFADWTPSEWASLVPSQEGVLIDRSTQRHEMRGQGYTPMTDVYISNTENIPDSFDWYATDILPLTRVKNQGTCGACWAFSTIAALESAYRIAGNNLTALSEQYILDCFNMPGLNGCSGSDVRTLLENFVGVPLPMERDLQFDSYNGDCCAACPSVPTAVTPRRSFSMKAQPGQLLESVFAAWVAQNGTIIAQVVANNAWQKYQGGIVPLSQCPPPAVVTGLNHGVLIVGYGTDVNGTAYWKIKNSWGPTYGENGYIRIQRGVNACGIGLIGYAVGV